MKLILYILGAGALVFGLGFLSDKLFSGKFGNEDWAKSHSQNVVRTTILPYLRGKWVNRLGVKDELGITQGVIATVAYGVIAWALFGRR